MKRSLIQAIAIVVLSIYGAAAFAQSEAAGDETFDGLKKVQTGKVALAYVLPGADFTRYTRIQMEGAHVAFKKDWSREQEKATEQDMNRIRERAAGLLGDVFADVLENGGYPVVDHAGANVLLLRPAIIDLDITPPAAGEKSGSTYVTSGGAATLSLEIFDSTTGAILARVIDRKYGRDFGELGLDVSMYNSTEAVRIFKGWARALKDRLDEIHGRKKSP